MLGALRASIALPYIENWPYTWIVYIAISAGGLALLLTTRRGNLLTPDSSITLSRLFYSFTLFFIAGSVFSAFALRRAIEPLQSYSFDSATVVGKYRSFNHNYPAIAVVTDDGRELAFDLPGQEELWTTVEVGGLVRKEFLREQIVVISPPTDRMGP